MEWLCSVFIRWLPDRNVPENQSVSRNWHWVWFSPSFSLNDTMATIIFMIGSMSFIPDPGDKGSRGSLSAVGQAHLYPHQFGLSIFRLLTLMVIMMMWCFDPGVLQQPDWQTLTRLAGTNFPTVSSSLSIA